MDIYVKALMQVAPSPESQQEWIDFLTDLEQHLTSNTQLTQVLYHPKLSLSDRLNFLAECFQATEKQKSFLFVLLKDKKIKKLNELLRAFKSQCHRAQPVLSGTMTSCVDVNKHLSETVEKLFQQKLGKKVHLSYHKDQKTLGIFAQVGSYEYELTLDQIVDKLTKELQRG